MTEAEKFVDLLEKFVEAVVEDLKHNAVEWAIDRSNARRVLLAFLDEVPA